MRRPHLAFSVTLFSLTICLPLIFGQACGDSNTSASRNPSKNSSMIGALTIGAFMKVGGKPKVIAHRGFSGEAPENTMAAFAMSIDVGADMIELDVLLTRDGEVVVIHDETLDRTTDSAGLVADFTLAELKKLDAGSWFSPRFAGEKIPTLAEVLDLVKGKILLNIEIKTEAVTDRAEGGIAEKCVRLVNDRGMRDAIVFSSFDPRALKHVKTADPAMVTASLYNNGSHEGMTPAQVMEDAGTSGFNLSRKAVSAEIVEQCHALGRPVAVYTVNKVGEMTRIIDLGVDAIFTNFPDKMIELLEK